MRIHFHSYRTARSEIGALYYNSEVTQLLTNHSEGRYEIRPHNLPQWLLMSEEALSRELRGVGPDDFLFSNVGPHAYLYCYLRDKLGLDVRIVRDIRTSFWIGHFLQETLCAPFTRDTDLVLFPSQFTRQLFIQLFPRSLNLRNTAVSYPLASFFPAKPKARQRPSGAVLNIGYIGRMSDAKNFDQVLGIYAALRKAKLPCRLHLLGRFDKQSQSRSIGDAQRFLRKAGVSPEGVIYRGFVSYRDIWQFYDTVDLLLFPSAASVESLGRILVEASHWNVPVIASHYAAAPEILPADNVAPFLPAYERDFSMLRPCSLGRMDIDFAIRKITERADIPVASIPPQYYSDHFFSVLDGERGSPDDSLTPFLRSLIENVYISPDYTAIRDNKAEARHMSGQLWNFMRAYAGRSTYDRAKLFLGAMKKSQNRIDTVLHFLLMCRSPDFFIIHSHIRELCSYFDIDFTFKLMQPEPQKRNDPNAPRVQAA